MQNRVGRRESQQKLVLDKVEMDTQRHLGKEAKIEERSRERLASAKASLEVQHISPKAYGLLNLTAHRNSYPISKMVETLVERERRRNPAINIGERTAELLKESKGRVTELRVQMVQEFYPPEITDGVLVHYVYVAKMTMAPANGSAERQKLGADFAKANGWVQKEVAAGAFPLPHPL